MTENGISQAEVLKLLHRKWITTDKLAEQLNIEDQRKLRDVLNKLHEDGIVETTRIGRYAAWRLPKTSKPKSKGLDAGVQMFQQLIKSEKDVQLNLQVLGADLYQDMSQAEFPYLDIPSRSTSNITFDPEIRQYVLANNTQTRSSKNINQIRSLSQQIWVMRFIKELVASDKSSTLRDVFYQSYGFDIQFNDQAESDNIITDTEAVLKAPREAFKVFPEERSAIYGDLDIEYTTPKKYAGRRVNLMANPDGMMIGPHIIDSKISKPNPKKVDKVIAIESGGMFTRFIEEEAHERFKSILIHTAGQAPRSTRRLIRRLHYEHNLPIYIFTDSDPWGVHIAMVIISGSAGAAHLYGLATPDATWMGVWATDIEKYKLPSFALTETDIRRTEQLLVDPRYNSPFWKLQLETFLKHKRKAEQQAFSKYSLSYVVDEYLPKKFEEIENARRRGLL